MSRKLTLQEVVDRLTVGLEAARWEYDAEADELEIVLPGGAGREGRAILLDSEVYLRLDADTNEPLTVIIPAVSVWLGQQVAQVATHLAAPRPGGPVGGGLGRFARGGGPVPRAVGARQRGLGGGGPLGAPATRPPAAAYAPLNHPLKRVHQPRRGVCACVGGASSCASGCSSGCSGAASAGAGATRVAWARMTCNSLTSRVRDSS